MKNLSTFSSLAAAILATASDANATEDSFSLSILGGYVFEDAPIGNKLFGPAVVLGVLDSGSQSGAYGAVDFRYGWDNQFVGFGYQYIGVDAGVPYASAASPADLGIEGQIIDIKYGRGFALASGTANWSVGLRSATFDIESVGNRPLHAFQGTGVRGGIETEMPLNGNGWSWFSDAGLSILAGEIETTPRGSWVCTDCTTTDTTAVGVDAKIGLNYNTGGNLTWKMGYQMQYWSGVNVEFSDNTNFGGNQGTSDLLVHGPFVGVNMRF